MVLMKVTDQLPLPSSADRIFSFVDFCIFVPVFVNVIGEVDLSEHVINANPNVLYVV